MSNEVSIDMDKFDSIISKFKSARNSISNKDWSDDELDKTNIKPFTRDLENIIETFKQLQRYEQLLNSDIKTLCDVGETMDDNDKKLSQSGGPMQ